MAASDLLLRWLERARMSSLAHYTAHEHYSRLNYSVGIPATILSAIVGTAVFASLDTVVDIKIKIAVGLLSVVSASLTALQTFLRFSDSAEQHRKAAVEYSSVRRELEQALTYIDIINSKDIEDMRLHLDKVTKFAPNVSHQLFNKADKLSKQDFYKPTPQQTRLQPPPSPIASSENCGNQSVIEPAKDVARQVQRPAAFSTEPLDR